MRILSLTVRNYRGVVNRRVEFLPVGVTVVEGPNEIGKTSLLEALDFLIEHADNTSRQDVMAAQPIGRDVGAEVEVVLETGEYALTYFKRFHRDRETRVVIHRPRLEQLTGREAHDRVRQILEETVDTGLWKALRIQQGTAAGSSRLIDSLSLRDALDRAAGGSGREAREEGLFEAIEKEYRRYFTPKGQPGSELRDLRARLADLRRDLDDREQRLARAQDDVEQVEDAEAELVRIDRQIQMAAAAAAEAQARLSELERLEGRVAVANARLQSAAAERERLSAEWDRRRERVAECGRLARLIAETAGDRKTREQAADRQQAALQEAQAALAAARATRAARAEWAEWHRLDVDYYRDLDDRGRWLERRDRVHSAHRQMAEWAAVMDAIGVREEHLTELRRLQAAVLQAEARRDVSAPTVVVSAAVSVQIGVNGQEMGVDPGSPEHFKVSGPLRIDVPGGLSVEVIPPVETESTVIAAKAARDALCRTIGVSDMAEAERQYQLWKDGERERGRIARELKEALDGLTPEELAEEIEALERRILRYRAIRSAAPPAAPDLAQAREWAEAARENLRQAEHGLTEAEAEAARMSQAFEAARGRLADLLAAERLRQEDHLRLQRDLTAERERVSDEELEARVGEVTRQWREADEVVRQLQKAREELGADWVRERAENAQEAVDTLEQRRRQIVAHRSEAELRLRVAGDVGIFEECERARIAYERQYAVFSEFSQRAEAARHLYETVGRLREAAEMAYRQPLKEKIRQLGQYVFGPSFDVELQADLSIQSRTVDGLPVPFASLSMGAREQTALLARLAAGLLVARDGGGVPVILDDALGFSDPRRLRAMATVLHFVGKQCQIIILTCDPDRYRQIGQAKSVVLHRDAAPGAAGGG